ncbi:MAG: hypothetical protein F6K59_36885, partial [Moorea sp. SIO3F7]|nr:hypothetical protein [Moorena sp. SIO3F7]
APTGRFIEIGKIGIWDQQQVKEKRPDVRYYPFDLSEVVKRCSAVLGVPPMSDCIKKTGKHYSMLRFKVYFKLTADR